MYIERLGNHPQRGPGSGQPPHLICLLWFLIPFAQGNATVAKTMIASKH